MLDDLSRLTASDIDSLPFGYVALATDGTVRRYNRYEADLARKDPQEVLGRSFFREVAPCTQVREFEGRFAAFVASDEPSTTFEFTFRFRHGDQRVRIAFVRAPLPGEVIMTVLRVRPLGIPLSAEVRHDPIAGRLDDDAGLPVVIANPDFWRALDDVWRPVGPDRRREALESLGRTWGRGHVERLERLLQREHGKTLREAELGFVLELASGSLGVLGLGRFDAELGWRDRGVLVIRHHASPFPALLERESPACDLLAGLHAAVVGHLAGQPLAGREIACAHRPGEPCTFVVGTERRLAQLAEAPAGSADALLLRSILGEREPPVPTTAAGMATAGTVGA